MKSWLADYLLVLQPRPDTLARLHELLARAQIFGGAADDAVVALAARDSGLAPPRRTRGADL